MRRAVPLAASAAALAGLAAAAPPPPRGPSAGERAYQKCYSCHALEPGRNDLEGPTLHRIVGRRIAAEPGFGYSPALQALAKRERRWSPSLLDRYIADPEAVAPHTSMTFTGIAGPDERAALVAWLRARR